MKKKAILFKKLPNNKVMCTACNHYCTPENWKTWKCGIRLNDNWELYLMTYWNAIWLHVDPVEKKPLYHFLPWSPVLSFWTAWCNFSCTFCQNREMSQQKWENWNIEKWKNDGYNQFFWNEFISPKYIVDYCLNNNIPSIAYTYNEPTVFFEYAYETMKLAKKNQIKNIFVSNGFMSKECREKLVKNWLLDAINIDLKSFSEEFYKNICGWRLQPVLDNIKFFWKHNVWVELTTLIIPWLNDSDQELEKIAKFIYNVSPDIPRHISAFYPTYKMMDKPATPVETLEKAYQIGKKIWLNFVYIGNVLDSWYEDTYCPKCNEKIINRIWFTIHNFFQKPWICPKCWENIVGRRN